MSTADTSEPRAPTAAPVRYHGMAQRHPPLTASTATAHAASLRLFGDPIDKPSADSNRGKHLRYVLRKLYGADYRRRGAALLGVTPQDLSRMFRDGTGVSRRIVRRLAASFPDRARHRRDEQRALARAIEGAFSAEDLSDLSEHISLLLRLASVAANTRQPHSMETGRFVSRDQSKAPVLREGKKNR